ncbi:MAG: sulfotransferase [Desulfobacterales bacterium]
MKNSNASKTLHFGNGQIKVLYIAGPTRSGSTILSNILGQISGFFHAGEVIEAWDRGRLWKCSCGQLPQECPVWSEIFMTLDAAFDAHDRAAIIRKRDRLSRSHKVILNHYLGLDHSSGNQQESKYFQSLAKLYAVIKTQTQADVIIDSSKNAGYAHSLLNVSNIDLHVVHLVRDSRATAFSWSKKKQELWKANPLRTSMEWS